MTETKKHMFSPSLACMSYAKFEEQIRFLDRKADFFHVDVMDGHYVSALGLSPDFISQTARLATKPIDAHLTLENPGLFVSEIVSCGASLISVHPDTISRQAFRFWREVEKLGARMGVVLSPATGISAAEPYLEIAAKVTVMTVDPGFTGQRFITAMLRKIDCLKNMKLRNGYAYLIEADGSCNQATFKALISAGTEVFVIGYSGLFHLDSDIAAAWQKMESSFASAL